jgi:hypothetical protein
LFTGKERERKKKKAIITVGNDEVVVGCSKLRRTNEWRLVPSKSSGSVTRKLATQSTHDSTQLAVIDKSE